MPEPYYETATTEIWSAPSAGGQAAMLTKIDMGVGGLQHEP